MHRRKQTGDGVGWRHELRKATVGVQATTKRRTDLSTVIIGDPHAAVRQSFRHYLESAGRLRVLGEAGELSRLASLLEWQQPDVVLVSAAFGPGLAHFVRAIKRLPPGLAVADGSPAPPLVVYGLGNDSDVILALARAGAEALVSAEASVQELVEAVEAVLRRERYVSPRYGGILLREVQRWSVLHEGHTGVRLTRREAQLLQLVASGLSNKEIADALSLAESTVKNRLSLLFDKLGVKDRTQAAIFALANGVLQQPLVVERASLPEA